MKDVLITGLAYVVGVFVWASYEVRAGYESFMDLDIYEKVLMVCLVVIGFSFAAMVFTVIQNGREWAEYSAKYNCKAVDRKPDTLVPTTTLISGPNGTLIPVVTTQIVPGKIGYLCDGRTEIIWR